MPPDYLSTYMLPPDPLPIIPIINPRSPGIPSAQFKTGNYRFSHIKADKKTSQSVYAGCDMVNLMMNSKEEIEQAFRDYRDGVLTL